VRRILVAHPAALGGTDGEAVSLVGGVFARLRELAGRAEVPRFYRGRAQTLI